jgi:hypothetical protein
MWKGNEMIQISSHDKFQFCKLVLNHQTLPVFYLTYSVTLTSWTTYIRESEIHMKIYCTAGITTTKMNGDLKGYGNVWYHSTGINNILSLARGSEKGKYYHLFKQQRK